MRVFLFDAGDIFTGTLARRDNRSSIAVMTTRSLRLALKIL